MNPQDKITKLSVLIDLIYIEYEYEKLSLGWKKTQVRIIS